MKPSLHFLLFTHFEHHPVHFSSVQESEYFAQYATNNLYSLDRFFPDHTVVWHTLSYQDIANDIHIDFHEYDAVFVGGSPWNIDDNKPWMENEKKILQEGWRHSTPPFFGICFGHQLFAHMLGGQISKLETPCKENISYWIGDHFLTSWTNHSQYVSILPEKTHVYSTVEIENVLVPYIVRYHPNIWGIQPHIEKNIGDGLSESFWQSFFQKNILGTSLGVVEIDGIDLEIIFSPSPRFSYSLDGSGKYLGIRGQCVELIRRFIYEKYSINLADFFVDGNATHWYEHAEIMSLERIEKSNVQPGDILCFAGGFFGVGHLALVQTVSPDGVFIVQQNAFHDERDLHFFLHFSHFDFNGFVYQGALRYSEIV